MTDIAEQTINLADYRPHPQNYNKHSDEQIAKLALSLEHFGQVRNIVLVFYNGQRRQRENTFGLSDEMKSIRTKSVWEINPESARVCRAVEISPAYVAVCLDRFQRHTGIQPERVWPENPQQK